MAKKTKCGFKWEVVGIKSTCVLPPDHYGPSHFDEDGRPCPDESLPVPLGPEE